MQQEQSHKVVMMLHLMHELNWLTIGQPVKLPIKLETFKVVYTALYNEALLYYME